jgi:quinoprotein glucose dehydrogenase
MTAPPILVDLNVDGRPIKALVQLTKQAFAYVFDRVTGEPVWPLEERPVPQTDVPGEWTSPTQPFPTKPPPFDRQGVTRDDLIDFTPELNQMALQLAEKYRLGPLYTPPSLAASPDGTEGTLGLPGSLGGANWEAGAADPETGYVYVGSQTRVAVHTLVPPSSGDMNLVAGRGGSTVEGLTIIKPPYGRITAYDMNKGEIAWQVPNGETPQSIKEHPLLEGIDLPKTGSRSRAGILVTKTLMFAGEGWGGLPMFRAYDKATGEIIWETEIPAGAQTGGPMAYMHEGQQYIVFTAGDARTRTPGQMIAYRLPE